MADDVELRTREGDMHGVLRAGLILEVKRGRRLYLYDLLASLAHGRPIYALRLVDDPNTIRPNPGEGLDHGRR